jgi:DNA primase
MEIKIVRLPEGHDPDSYIRDIGIEAFKKAMQGAMPLFDYRLGLLKKQFGTATLDAKVKVANEMVKLFGRVRNEILVSAWTKELATQLQLSERALEAETRKSKDGDSRERERHAAPAPKAPRPATLEVRPVERLLLGLLLDRPRMVGDAAKTLAPEDFENEGARRLYARLAETAASGGDMSVAHLMNSYEGEPATTQLVSTALAEAERCDDKEKALSDCIGKMKEMRLVAERERLRVELKRAEDLGNKARIDEINHDIHEINKEIKGVKKIR